MVVHRFWIVCFPCRVDKKLGREQAFSLIGESWTISRTHVRPGAIISVHAFNFSRPDSRFIPSSTRSSPCEIPPLSVYYPRHSFNIYFPADFMFQLTAAEVDNLRFHFGISSSGHGGRRYLPYAFTEQGVAMLSSVLRSPRAVAVNVEIMRAFVRLRRMLAGNAELARKLDALEQKYDSQFKAVFDAIRQLMAPDSKARREMGFHTLRGDSP